MGDRSEDESADHVLAQLVEMGFDLQTAIDALEAVCEICISWHRCPIQLLIRLVACSNLAPANGYAIVVSC
ncbi:hypothetical protein EJ110_NYTH46320 [Nymphaea thermarum]|nr:hypothetical protein EJ110_NYTH46320 [Nymphaea thermarum]